MMIKNLSKNVCKKYPDFHVREDLNFEDDGNHFRGFDYKGLEISTLRDNKDGLTYLSIDPYYHKYEITWKEWSKTEEYKLADEFNGVPEIDLDKLIENCERIISKLDEMKETIKEDKLDMMPVLDRLVFEQDYIDNFLGRVKKKLKWWNLSKWDLERAARYIKLLEEKADFIPYIKEHSSRAEKKHMLETLEDYGFVRISTKDFYFTELEKLIEENK